MVGRVSNDMSLAADKLQLVSNFDQFFFSRLRYCGGSDFCSSLLIFLVHGMTVRNGPQEAL